MTPPYSCCGSAVAPPNKSASKSTLQETPVFVPPPPPPNDAMLPRLAKLEKTRADEEFGFNLHAERGRGHFIGTVDAGGIGERAGLEEEQRIVGVNGQLIYPNTSHKEVVALIKKFPMSTTLLVASESVDKYHRDHNIPFSFENVEIRPAITVETHHHQHQDEVKSNGYEAPSLNPHSIQVNEEREISKVTTTTKTEVISTNTGSYQYKVTDRPLVITTCSFLNESSTTYNTNVAPLAPEASDDLMSQVFGNILLPPVGNQVTLHSATREEDDDASSVTSLSSSHRESAVDVPVDHKVLFFLVKLLSIFSSVLLFFEFFAFTLTLTKQVVLSGAKIEFSLQRAAKKRIRPIVHLPIAPPRGSSLADPTPSTTVSAEQRIQPWICGQLD
uniref:PDZ domain-containing protein n=2 Tax=Caenorhabditis japonica TaxID=281687 RepID=A0A8R1HMY6_CAEJA